MESGACVVPSAERVRTVSSEQIGRSGCSEALEGEIACLRAKSPSDILRVFLPVIDVDGKSSDFQPYADGRVLIAQPNAIIAQGRHSHVPLIIGANADETSRMSPSISSVEDYESLVTMTFGLELGRRVLEIYPASDYPSPRAAYVAATSDAKFICNARRDARAAAQGQVEPVFRYFFTQALENAPRLAPFGAYHGLELFFVFQELDFAGYRASERELVLADWIGTYWTRLAAQGDPNGSGAPVWERYDRELDRTMVLNGSGPEMVNGIRTRQCDFWDSIAF